MKGSFAPRRVATGGIGGCKRRRLGRVPSGERAVARATRKRRTEATEDEAAIDAGALRSEQGDEEEEVEQRRRERSLMGAAVRTGLRIDENILQDTAGEGGG